MPEHIAPPGISSKNAPAVVLVPNRDILQLVLAEHFHACPEGSVAPEPAVFMLSSWVEQKAVRIRRLREMEVPASLDAWSGMQMWLRKAPLGTSTQGRGFTLNAAGQARAADRLIKQWHTADNPPWLEDDFYAWRSAVHAEMRDAFTFDAEDWMADLVDWLETSEASALDLPGSITTRGFAELTPLESRLFECLVQRGVELAHTNTPPATDWPPTLRFASPEDEVRAAVQWAKGKLDDGAKRVCIVMPRSHTASGHLSRLLRGFLTQTLELHPDDNTCPQAFYVPSCRPLAAHTAFQDAMALLQVSLAGTGSRVDFPLLSQWLLSPHWGGEEAEAQTRALLEFKLRRHGLFRLSLAEVVTLARREKLLEALPVLQEMTEGLQGLSLTGNAGRDAWALLNHWGWPGQGVGPELARVVDRCSALLERMALLPAPVPELNHESLLLLEKEAEDSFLGYGGGPLSPVQVLPAEVAAAGRFDAIWVSNLDESNWPPPVTPNPLLPAASRGVIPRMNPDGQFAHHEALTRSLCLAASEVALSWSEDAGEGPRGRSGVLQGAPDQVATTTQCAESPATEMPAPNLETIEDTSGIPYDTSEPVRIPGGAGFFSRQAACPMWAYLAYRMSTDFPSAPEPFADPMFRGILLHRALKALYERADSERGIPEQSAIAPAVDEVLGDSAVRARLTATGMAAERKRLKRILRDWLALDASRQGFSVAGLETARRIELSGAVIKVQIDRTDRLDDGRLFLIDYKSSGAGGSRALKWLNPRIQEPQLPLYAVLLDAIGQEIGGISLAAAGYGSNQVGFDGITDDPVSKSRGIRQCGVDRGRVKSIEWNAIMEHWRGEVQLLLGEILAGHAPNRVYDADAMRFSNLDLVLRPPVGISEDEELGSGD